MRLGGKWGLLAAYNLLAVYNQYDHGATPTLKDAWPSSKGFQPII